MSFSIPRFSGKISFETTDSTRAGKVSFSDFMALCDHLSQKGLADKVVITTNRKTGWITKVLDYGNNKEARKAILGFLKQKNYQVGKQGHIHEIH